MEAITVKELLAAVHGELLQGDETAQILGVNTDSRTVKAGEVFVPLVGERFDGHDYIEKAISAGAEGCLCARVPETLLPGKFYIKVPDTLLALKDLAAWYRAQFSIPFVQVTGSVGKTTTKDMIASVVSQKYDTVWTQGNYNNEVGVPLTIFRIEEHHQAAIIEMGMNHFGELDRIAKAVRPNIGVISNVGVAHIEFLGSREGILKAKCEMLAHLEKDGVAILNADNDMLQTLEGKLPQRVRWFGVEHKKDFYADEIAQVGLEKTACTIHTPIGSVRVNIPIPGVHMVLNALSAAAVGVELGLTPEQVKAGIEGFRATKNRMSIETTKDGITILNDVYNSNPVSWQKDCRSGLYGRAGRLCGRRTPRGRYPCGGKRH